MAMPIRNQPLEASNTISVPQRKQALYVPAYASPVSAAEQQERLAMLERIPQNASVALARLTTTNYQVDRSGREAILAPPDCWHEEADIPVFTSSDNLKVYSRRAPPVRKDPPTSSIFVRVMVPGSS